MNTIVAAPRRFQPDAGGWQALFAAIDARDAVAFAAFLTADAEFRFGNAEPVRGRDGIIRAVSGFFCLIAACRHHVTRSWKDLSSAVCEGEVRYESPGGAAVTVPFVNVLELTAMGISSYRIYIDNGPLFAAIG